MFDIFFIWEKSMDWLELFSQNPLLLVVLLAVGAVIFINGWTDAPTAIATCVTSGALSLRWAVIMAALCNLAGISLSVAVSPAVAVTVRDMVRLPAEDGRLSLAVLLCAMVATALWAVTAWVFGIPTSESHALLSGLSGAAMAYGGAGCVMGGAWLRVVLGLFLSLAGGLLAGFLAFVVVDCFCQRHGGENTARGMKRALTVGAAAMAFMHGAQDGQKFIGMWLLALSLGGAGDSASSAVPVLACALLMGTGTLVGGGRIIRTLGEKLVRSGYREGLAADIGAAVCLLFLTLGGLPVSTTHTKTAALMGTGLAKGRGGSDMPTAAKLVLAWLLTFPACFSLAYLGMKGLLIVYA